jgi:hypothetical protein
VGCYLPVICPADTGPLLFLSRTLLYAVRGSIQNGPFLALMSVGFFGRFRPHEVSDILYYFDQSFTILEKIYSEMADKFSFDLRRIKTNSFFSDVTVT